jgi:hypothetical protein
MRWCSLIPKLEAVKAKFTSTKEHEQINETNIDFTQINNIESKEYTNLQVSTKKRMSKTSSIIVSKNYL